ncbi:hypothetical protein ESCO_000322 [Escovopsis weberi]|uniref:Uncharacterized protein n=1 Tax=Escovopsis weberi TaxID=150374 RepID=A0A0M8N4Q0_ESCWE|nr:hypothetical protein ESCO_000322 [Escovopsis weberi]
MLPAAAAAAACSSVTSSSASAPRISMSSTSGVMPSSTQPRSRSNRLAPPYSSGTATACRAGCASRIGSAAAGAPAPTLAHTHSGTTGTPPRREDEREDVDGEVQDRARTSNSQGA